MPYGIPCRSVPATQRRQTQCTIVCQNRQQHLYIRPSFVLQMQALKVNTNLMFVTTHIGTAVVSYYHHHHHRSYRSNVTAGLVEELWPTFEVVWMCETYVIMWVWIWWVLFWCGCIEFFYNCTVWFCIFL